MRPITLCLAATALVVVLTLSPSTHAEGDPLESMESLSRSWIDTRAETVRTETDWRIERELLVSLIDALEARAAEAEEARDLRAAQTAKDREEVEALEARLRQADEDNRRLEARLVAISQALVSTRGALPPRLSDALDVSLRSLAGNELTVGERMQLVVSVLNRCIQFDRSIIFGEEVVTSSAGTEPRMREVIYWGLSHGYAVDRAAGKAWFGRPREGAWHWETRDDLLEPAIKLIEIHNDRRDPEFISVPARIDVPVNASATP